MAAGSRSSASGSSACSWASSSVGSMAAASLRPAGWKPSMTQHSAPTHLVLQTPREPQVPAGSWSNMEQQVARPILTGHGATWWDGAVRATAQQPNTSPNNNVPAELLAPAANSFI
ncbi:hypothetical protein SETIT_2G082800v2 [Setaria italica]|uniref:Uncharacterized protein n=1 Tax=Setaria italica TaxID=4555 RepID=A0A368PWG7_SETIT|nr:hypothetical protein SETIT_2G082800v2 [Setaria italica]